MVPVKMLFPKVKRVILLVSYLIYCISAWINPSLSKMATENPEFSHCGPLSYTGSLFSIRNFLSEAYADDLEIRNQLCWLRKLISNVPDNFENAAELNFYLKLTRDKLLKPEFKYRAALPLVALLELRIFATILERPDKQWMQDSLNFWISQYTYEISERDYTWINWPHADYIKWEYGLIEKNWQNLVEGLTIQK